jgi:hypothetical protein
VVKVRRSTCGEDVHTDDVIASIAQHVDEMRTDEAGASGDQHVRHYRSFIGMARWSSASSRCRRLAADPDGIADRSSARTLPSRACPLSTSPPY